MIKLCPQWHLKSMKEHVPTVVLGRLLFFFCLIFLFFKWADWKSLRHREIYGSPSDVSLHSAFFNSIRSGGHKVPQGLQLTCSSLAMTCTTLGCTVRSWVMDFSTSPTQGKWLTILSVITLKVSPEVKKLTHEELQKCWPSNILKLWRLLSTSQPQATLHLKLEYPILGGTSKHVPYLLSITWRRLW